MKIAVLDPSCFTMPYDHCLCEALARKGCDVAFVGSRYAHANWNLPTAYQRWNHFYVLTDRLYRGASSGIFRVHVKGLEHLADMGRLVTRLRDWKPDVIHFQWLTLPAVDRFFTPLLRRIAPLVFTVHDSRPFHGSPSSRLQMLGFSESLRAFDHLIVHVSFTREELLRNFGIPSQRISVIPYGALHYYRRFETSHLEKVGGQAQRENTILFFGVIRPNKGLDVLIRALARVTENIAQKTRLHVCGLPKMPIAPLEKLARELGVSEMIRWDLRFVPEEEVASVFEKATVVALPYREIDQSAVLMTAMAFGKPIVTTRVGGFPEVVRNDVHGYVVDPEDVQALAGALEQVLSDPDRARRMGAAVRRLADHDFCWGTVAEKTIKVYRELLRPSNHAAD